MGLTASRKKRLLVKRLVNAKLPARDHLQLVRTALRDGVTPLGDGAFGDFEGFGQRLRGAEVGDSGGLLHVGRSYSMLNLEVKDGKPPSSLSCLGMDSAIESMGSRIKTLRRAKGLTQTQLGQRVGVTKGAVSQWEGGLVANIKLHTVLQLCDVFGTDLQFLVHGEALRRRHG
jgi:DNA-binding XRE family transcriptional regulator